jgi:hypothetical protein
VSDALPAVPTRPFRNKLEDSVDRLTFLGRPLLDPGNQQPIDGGQLLAGIAVAAALIFAVAGWLWVRIHHSVQPPETAVLDLRDLSLARGQNPNQAGQRPLEIHRSVKHLILDLPIGSKEGAYEIGLLSETGAPVLGSSGTARLEDQVVILRLDLDVSRVQSGRYFLALRQPGLEWARYPVRIL